MPLLLKRESNIFLKKNSSPWQDSFQNLLHKQEGKRAEWEYPFAVAGINISFMLVEMLDLQSGKLKQFIKDPHSA